MLLRMSSALHLCFPRIPSISSCCVSNAMDFQGKKIRGTPSGCFCSSLDFESKPSGRGKNGFIEALEFTRRADRGEISEEMLAVNSAASVHEKMIEIEPGNPLFLRNYAKFLEEVKGDIDKAEEFYQRAILANPKDGEVLSLYADFTWRIRRDARRAESYFRQAVQANPNDCYVLSSYAHFLWNYEDETEGDESSSLSSEPVNYTKVSESV